MTLKYIEKLLLYMNVIIMIFIMSCIHITTNNIIKTNASTEFIDTVSTIAYDSYSLLVLIILGSVILILFDIFIPEYKWIDILIEIGVIICMIYVLSFNYNGIILYIIVKALAMEEKDTIKYIFLSLGIVLFIGTNQSLIASNFKAFEFTQYIDFYNGFEKSFLYVIHAILTAINIVIFIVYCSTYIYRQQAQIDEVNMLYQELNRKNEELQQKNLQLIRYADEREQYGQINERNRVAREIHDTLGHMLTGLNYGLEASLSMIDQSVEKTKNHLTELLGISRRGISEVRRSVNALRSDDIFLENIEKTLVKLIQDSRKLTDIDIEYDIELTERSLSEDEALTIYRIVQEGITNALRHSKAKTLWIRVKEEGMTLLIVIKDDGVGCKNIKEGFGTLHIVERVTLLNGEVEYRGEDGFEIRVWIPLRLGN